MNEAVPVDQVPSDRNTRRRFVIASVVGALAALPGFLWVLTDLWRGGPSLIRSESPSAIYTLQAKAMLHGHLFVAPGSLGVEGFVHGGRTFTYFGIFPSVLRAPVLLVFPDVPGTAFTSPMLLAAWLVTGVATVVLGWRIRCLLRATAPLGRIEAVGIAAFTASVLGGSVLLNLASNPAVYSEDFAWSVALLLSSLAGLLLVLERPSAARIATTALLVLCTCLNRLTTGWAAALGLLIAAAWLWWSPRRTGDRRWAWPLAAAGVIAILVSSAVTFAKFGTPFGLPMADQVFTQVNAHRREFLAANGGRAFSLAFLPTTLNAYLNPLNLSASGILPFLTLPTSLPKVFLGVTMDQRLLTASATASMPLLSALGIWGGAVVLRRRPPGRIALARIVVLVAAIATVGILVWGFVATRYLADILPLLVVAGAIGLADLFRRAAFWPRHVRIGSMALVVILALWSVIANIGIASAPTGHWSRTQVKNLVVAQRDHSISSLSSKVVHADHLPASAPLGALYEIGACQGLYLSDGTDRSSIPGEQLQHAAFLPVEQTSGVVQEIRIRLSVPSSKLDRDVTLLRYGHSVFVLHPVGGGVVSFVLRHAGHKEITWPGTAGGFTQLDAGPVYGLRIMADPVLGSFRAFFEGTDLGTDGTEILARPVAPARSAKVVPSFGSVRVTGWAASAPMSICQSLR